MRLWFILLMLRHWERMRDCARDEVFEAEQEIGRWQDHKIDELDRLGRLNDESS